MTTRTITLPLAALLATGVIAGCGDDETTNQAATSATSTATAPAPEPRTTTTPSKDPGTLAINVKDNEPVGGFKSLTVEKGEPVRFTVSADKPEEVHVHAYDISKDVRPGKPARFDFPASIEGIFEVELEGASVQILKLTVNP